MANTYKFIYEANKGEGRKIYGALGLAKSEADQVIIDIEDIKEEEFKLIYEKEGIIYGSLTGVVGDDDKEICKVKALYEVAAQPDAGADEEEVSDEEAEEVQEVEQEEQPEEIEEEIVE